MTKCCCRLPVIWSTVSLASCTFRFRRPAVNSIPIIPVPRLPNVPAGPRITGIVCLHCTKTEVKKKMLKKWAMTMYFCLEVFGLFLIVWVCIQHLFNFRAAANSYIPSYTALKCSKHLEQLISFPPMWHQYILIRMLHLREIKLFVPTVLGSTLTHDNYFIPTP